MISTAIEKQFDRTLLEQIPEALEITSLGEGLKLVKAEKVEFDHKMATYMIELPEVAADRPLTQAHVMRIKAAMERGTYLSDLVQLIVCTCNGKVWRINGQHNSWARLEMPEKWRCTVNLLRYKAETDADMRRLYASVDRGKARTKGNVVNSYIYNTPEWAGYGKHVLGWLSEGLGVWLWEKGHERTMRDGDDRAFLLMTEHYKLARLVGDFIQSNQSSVKIKFLRRAPVIAAMLATFNVDPKAALEFWSAVADGTGFDTADDPRNVLRTGLMQSSLRQGGAGSAGITRRAMSSEEMYRCCVYSWLNWREGRPMKTLRANLNFDRPTLR